MPDRSSTSVWEDTKGIAWSRMCLPKGTRRDRSSRSEVNGTDNDGETLKQDLEQW